MTRVTSQAAGRPRHLVVGVGLRPGTSAREVEALVQGCLRAVADERAAQGAAGGAVDAIPPVAVVATVAERVAEPALQALAAYHGASLRAFPRSVLATQEVPSPSARVRALAATPSVAEAAVLAAGGELVAAKRRSPAATVAVGLLEVEGPNPRPEVEVDLAHHGDAELSPGLVDLAVNVRRTAPPRWLHEVLVDSLDDVARYPHAGPATRAVARRHARPEEEVLVTCGAAEAFTLLARALRPGADVRHAVVVHPQFTEPEQALRAAGHAVERVLLRAEDGFALAPSEVPEGADLVVLGNPTNPTSVLHPADAVRALVRPGRVLLVDEAFLDAVPGEPGSLADERLPGLVAVRSLTKTWGLAGVRAGYVVGDPHVLARLRAVQPSWAVPGPALAAVAACCRPAALQEAHELAVEGQRQARRLAGRLVALGLEVVPPAAPFVCVRVAGGLAVRERLRDLGFAVRRGDTFPGLGADWLRVAARDDATADAFLAALEQALGRRPPAAGA